MPSIDAPDTPRAQDRISTLVEMLTTLSQTRDPRETLDLFFETMRKMWRIRGYIGLACGGLPDGQYRILRHQGFDGQDLIPSIDFGIDESLIVPCSGGWLDEVCRSGGPRLFRDLDVPDDPVLGAALADYRCAMAAPIFEKGEVRRWAILFEQEPDGFDDEALEHFVLRANLVSTVIQNLRNLALLERAHSEIQREVERIAEIQRALLPSEIPDIPGLRIATSYETFDRAGGDIYSFANLGEDATGCVGPAADGAPWAIFIGDVSGHGPAAAVVMAMMHAIIEAYPQRPDRPSQVLLHANRHLMAKQIDASFVTAFLAFYDPTTRQLTYSAAGHPPPLWRKPRAQGGVEVTALDGVLGFPLGIVCDADYGDATITLQPGQTLAFFTDGIPEARGPDGRFFGTAGVEEAMRHCSGEASCLVDTLTKELKAFEHGGRPADDQTLLAIEIA